jgi:hypothetical protein
VADEPTHPAGVPVVIALAYKGEEQDHTRIGRVEYHPKSDARRMVTSGEARWVDDPRNTDDGWPIRDNDADDTDEQVADLALQAADEPRPLTAMSKSELRALIPGGVDLPDTTTRHELLAYARATRQPQTQPEQAAATPPEPVADQP